MMNGKPPAPVVERLDAELGRMPTIVASDTTMPSVGDVCSQPV